MTQKLMEYLTMSKKNDNILIYFGWTCFLLLFGLLLQMAVRQREERRARIALNKLFVRTYRQEGFKRSYDIDKDWI